ncbi:hypothetical protein GF360_02340 [candidate division WWE3 bacterium]|nr:hypothetical protein [candidate division WWE3 bacterium]
MSYLLFTEILHFLGALALFLLFLRFYKWYIAGFSFLFGFLIDVDHLFDYFYFMKFFNRGFNLRDFLSAQSVTTGKIFIPFHGWEWVVLLLLLALLFRALLNSGTLKKDFWKILAQILFVAGTSLFTHILTDYFTNEVGFGAYSFFWRWSNGFYTSLICGK